MSDEGPMGEPTAGDVEALVRAIAAKEEAAATGGAVAPTGGAAAATDDAAATDGDAAADGARAAAGDPEAAAVQEHPADPTAPAPDDVDAAPPRPVIVVSGPPKARRPPGEAASPGTTPAIDRRNRARPMSGPAAARLRVAPPAVAGLISRVEWDRLVADESERQRRYGRPSAIVLIEIDGLDRATAQSGPGIVGRVISPCGATLVAAARASDRVARLGDGRFGVLLREADADGAHRYVKRAVAACDPWLAALPWPLRLRVGWAAPDGGDDLLAALQLAERRLGASAAD